MFLISSWSCLCPTIEAKFWVENEAVVAAAPTAKTNLLLQAVTYECDSLNLTNISVKSDISPKTKKCEWKFRNRHPGRTSWELSLKLYTVAVRKTGLVIRKIDKDVLSSSLEALYHIQLLQNTPRFEFRLLCCSLWVFWFYFLQCGGPL